MEYDRTAEREILRIIGHETLISYDVTSNRYSLTSRIRRLKGQSHTVKP